MHVDGVFTRKTGTPAGPGKVAGVGIAEHDAITLGDDIGKPLGQDIGSAPAHIFHGRRIDLERRGAIQDVMGVDRLDRGDI